MPFELPATFGGIDVVADDTLEPGMLGFRDKETGQRLCMACGCPETHDPETGKGHAPYAKRECLTGHGTPEECLCAKFVPAIATCVDCGWQFPELWHLQNHRLPTPTCLSSAWAAGGRYAQRPKFAPPLREKARDTAR